jgi:CDP-glucose 4,6-dehydratase
MPNQVHPQFWRDRRVVLTGHTGFKGAWLTCLLHLMGARVFAISLPAEDPSLYQQARVGELVEAECFGDLADPAVACAIDDFEPEIIMHLAAQSLVRSAFTDPRTTFASNVMGVVQVLEAARRSASVRTVFVTTTDKVYLNTGADVAFQEGDPLGGVEPYGASKAAAEMALSAYRASYFEPAGKTLLIGRAGNVIGGGDWSKDRIIPDMIRAVQAGKPVEVRHPTATRPWQLVLDALEGYLLLIEAKHHVVGLSADPNDCAWNFGPLDDGDSVSVEQLCQWVQNAWPNKFSWQVKPDLVGALESKVLRLDPAKAMKDLDWVPKLTAQQAVMTTLAWYEQFMAGDDARSICFTDIARHFPHLNSASA